LATAAKDVLHIHGSHDGGHSGGEVADQLRPLRLPDVVREPGLHQAKVLASAQKMCNHQGALLFKILHHEY
jgi:hypothetical protein